MTMFLMGMAAMLAAQWLLVLFVYGIFQWRDRAYRRAMNQVARYDFRTNSLRSL